MGGWGGQYPSELCVAGTACNFCSGCSGCEPVELTSSKHVELKHHHTWVKQAFNGSYGDDSAAPPVAPELRSSP